MDLQAFRKSTERAEPPEGLGTALTALWWDAKGDWERAHEHAQEKDDESGMRIHAYLHRKEGDLPNAGYWYRRAAAVPFTGSLDAEWEELARRFLAVR